METKSKQNNFIIFFDGLCEPVNPGGVGAYGYIIYYDGKAVKKGCKVIGEGSGITNNIAEYSALKRSIERLNEIDIDGKVIVKGDSQLVINQMKGIWQVKSNTSRKFVPEIKKLIGKRKVIYQWIPRKQNTEADMLSRVAYKRYKNQKH